MNTVDNLTVNCREVRNLEEVLLRLPNLIQAMLCTGTLTEADKRKLEDANGRRRRPIPHLTIVDKLERVHSSEGKLFAGPASCTPFSIEFAL